MTQMIQQWIWLEALRTNWRAIQLRLMPASPALLQELAAIAERLRAAGSPQQFAAILDDLLDLIADTYAAEYVRGLMARNSMPEIPATPQTREEALSLLPTEPSLDRVETEHVLSVTTPKSDIQTAEAPEVVMAETGKALADGIVEPTGLMGVRVFFATNRKASDSQTPGERFGYDHAPETVFGHVSVSIPVSHKKGHLEKPGFFERRKIADHFAIRSDLEVLKIGPFRGKLEEQFRGEAKSDLLVFIHGFNVSFEDALLRAAQLKYDLNLPGEIVLFTWPSRGSLLSYLADLSSAEFSGTPLAEFLAAIAEGPWRRVHLLAHSMGGRVSLGGLVDSAAPEKGLGQIVLVAADVSTDFFTQQFPKLSAKGEGKTLYVASKDRALMFSGQLNRSGRVGYLEKEPFVIGGMDTVDASAVDRGLLAHSYFSDIRAVIDDLGYLLGNRLPASQRPNLRERRRATGELYWQFPS